MLDNIKETWTRSKGASSKLQELNHLERKHARLLLKAEKGDLAAYKEANLLAIKIKSLEDRLQGKANKVIDQYETSGLSIENA